MRRKTKRRVWALAGFLSIMLICTVLSRAAASVLVAQVQVEKPGRGRLSYSYGGNGTVVPVQEKTIFLWAGQQVEWVAGAGSTVKAGDCLIQFRMEPLQKAVQAKQAELAQLEIQIQQQQISARGTARVPSAERALQNLEEARKKLQEAQEKEAQVQGEYDRLAGNSADNSFWQQELSSVLQQARADAEAARQAEAQAQTEYLFAQKEDSAQNINEANAVQSALLGVQSLNVQADGVRQALAELTAYQNAGGRICAEQDCTVLLSGVRAGALTTGSEVMVTGSGGWRLKGLADTKDREKLKPGTEAEIRMGAGKKKTVRIEIGRAHV